MKNQFLQKFSDFALDKQSLIAIKGGVAQLCTCKAAAPYSCTAAGYTTDTSTKDTSDFNKCLKDTYAGCCQYDASCGCSS